MGTASPIFRSTSGGPPTMTIKRKIAGRALEPVNSARIVSDSRDARSDKFIPLAEAEALYKAGKLAKVSLGDAYPNSYQRV